MVKKEDKKLKKQLELEEKLRTERKELQKKLYDDYQTKMKQHNIRMELLQEPIKYFQSTILNLIVKNCLLKPVYSYNRLQSCIY